MSSAISIPLNPSQVTTSWLKSVLKAKGHDQDIIVYDINGHQNHGGVLSSVFKAYDNTFHSFSFQSILSDSISVLNSLV